MGDGGWVSLSRWRLAGALVLGHLAAAYSFAAAMLLVVALTDPDTALPRTPDAWRGLAQALAWSPLVVAALSLWTAMLMLPWSLLVSPLTYALARHLRTELPATAAMGAAVGVANVVLLLAWEGDFWPWKAPGHPVDPRGALVFPVCAAAAGMAYSAVVWRLCVRPRLERCGGARWSEV